MLSFYTRTLYTYLWLATMSSYIDSLTTVREDAPVPAEHRQCDNAIDITSIWRIVIRILRLRLAGSTGWHHQIKPLLLPSFAAPTRSVCRERLAIHAHALGIGIQIMGTFIEDYLRCCQRVYNCESTCGNMRSITKSNLVLATDQ